LLAAAPPLSRFCCAAAAACTGSTLVSTVKPKNNLYLEMAKATNDLFDQKFGTFIRYDPAHAPRLIHKKYLRELQEKIPEAVKQTSAAHARYVGQIGRAWGCDATPGRGGPL
jgi:hypothetical protein